MVRKSEGLSKRHQLILKFLAQFQEQNGYSPSIREIGESISVRSTSLVDYYLKQLEEMSYISREQHISRSIRLLKSFEPILLPLPAHIRKPAVMYELMKDTFEDCSPGCPELPVMTLWSNRINLFAIRTSIPLEPNSTADPI